MKKNLKPRYQVCQPGGLTFAVGLMFCLLAGMVVAQPNMLVNGSFESATGLDNFPGWNQFGPASNNSNFGVVASNTIPDVPEQGTNFAYFHGHPTDGVDNPTQGSQDCLGQSVQLTVGAQYNITYYLGTDAVTTGSGAAIWVVIGTSFGISLSADQMLTAFLPNSATSIPYQKFTTLYTATQADVIFSFHGIGSTNGIVTPSSILVDNVSITPVLPQLGVSRSPTNTLVFNWNAWTNGFRLQTNANLLTTNWGTLTNVPVTANATNQMILPAPTNSIFYRLRLP